MKKIIAIFVLLFMVGFASNGQSVSKQNKIKAKKISTKKKVMLAVQSDKAKTEIYRNRQPLRKED